jgi:hypothetical protein
VLLQVMTVVEKGNSLSSDANAEHGKKATDAVPEGGSYAGKGWTLPGVQPSAARRSSSVAFHRLVASRKLASQVWRTAPQGSRASKIIASLGVSDSCRMRQKQQKVGCISRQALIVHHGFVDTSFLIRRDCKYVKRILLSSSENILEQTVYCVFVHMALSKLSHAGFWQVVRLGWLRE